MKYSGKLVFGLSLSLSPIYGAFSQSVDLYPPTISLSPRVDVKDQQNKNEIFEAIIEDDVKISQVVFFFRFNHHARYKSRVMRLVPDSPNTYSVAINSELENPIGSPIEYYIDAEDTSGNFTLKGQEFNPLVRMPERHGSSSVTESFVAELETIKSSEISDRKTNNNSVLVEDAKVDPDGNLSRFFVNVEPSDARVRIMNIVPRYYPGIELQRGGSYRISVDKAGFKNYDSWIVVENAEETLNIALSSEPDTKRPDSNSKQVASCREAVQNQIAWDYNGSKTWIDENIEILCGNVNSTEPAICFSTIMHGGVDWGGGTQWEWQNALNLCSKTQDAKKTVQCFKDNMLRVAQWDMAIALCNLRR